MIGLFFSPFFFALPSTRLLVIGLLPNACVFCASINQPSHHLRTNNNGGKCDVADDELCSFDLRASMWYLRLGGWESLVVIVVVATITGMHPWTPLAREYDMQIARTRMLAHGYPTVFGRGLR